MVVKSRQQRVPKPKYGVRPLAHILNYGRPVCGFSDAYPIDWPRGHTWVPKTEVGSATCVECLARYAKDVSPRLFPSSTD